MAYRFEQNETLPDAVRRCARELTDDALSRLDAPGDDVEDAVHEVRKNCKKARGLVRLARAGLGNKAYRPANASFRDAARELSSFRDAHALLETFDVLAKGAEERLSADARTAVRAGLSAAAEQATAAVAGDDPRLARARSLLLDVQGQIEGWTPSSKLSALAAGLEGTYRRGRAGLAACLADPEDEALHDWRKRVKYTWYHVRLLQSAAPAVLEPLASCFDDLSDLLGEDHDLAVLSGRLRETPDDFGGAEAVEEALVAQAARRAELQDRALRLGVRLYVEKPKAFSKRLTGYWRVWQRD